MDDECESHNVEASLQKRLFDYILSWLLLHHVQMASWQQLIRQPYYVFLPLNVILLKFRLKLLLNSLTSVELDATSQGYSIADADFKAAIGFVDESGDSVA